MTDSPLQTSSVPSLSPGDTGWAYSGQTRHLPCAEPDGAKRCSQDTHGQPRLDGFEPLHHHLTWEGAGACEQVEHPEQGPARAVWLLSTGCTPALPKDGCLGMLPKSGMASYCARMGFVTHHSPIPEGWHPTSPGKGSPTPYRPRQCGAKARCSV